MVKRVGDIYPNAGKLPQLLLGSNAKPSSPNDQPLLPVNIEALTVPERSFDLSLLLICRLEPIKVRQSIGPELYRFALDVDLFQRSGLGCFVILQQRVRTLNCPVVDGNFITEVFHHSNAAWLLADHQFADFELAEHFVNFYMKHADNPVAPQYPEALLERALAIILN